MTTSTPHRHGFVVSWLLWTAGFLAFPIAGVAGRTVAGRVEQALADTLATYHAKPVRGFGQAATVSGE